MRRERVHLDETVQGVGSGVWRHSYLIEIFLRIFGSESVLRESSLEGMERNREYTFFLFFFLFLFFIRCRSEICNWQRKTCTTGGCTAGGFRTRRPGAEDSIIGDVLI